MERADRIRVLQSALDAVNAAIPAVQERVDSANSDEAEARASTVLIEAKNRRDDLSALLADMPEDGALTPLNADQVAQLGRLEQTIDQSIRNNALLNATLDGIGQVLQAANKVHDILS